MVFVLVLHYFMSFLVCNHLDEEERVGCFAFIVFLMPSVNVLWLFLMVPWVGLQFVIVVFPDHTHLLFHVYSCYNMLSPVFKTNQCSCGCCHALEINVQKIMHVFFIIITL